MAAQAPISLLELQAHFKDEQACREHLFRVRWPNGFCCPKCGNSTYYFVKGRDLYQCKECSHQASLTAGTVMHKTRTSLVKWFWAIYFIANDKRGCSSLSIQKAIGVCYETAWSMSHKIRSAMADRDAEYKLAGLVKVDDAYFGGASEGSSNSGRGTEKTPVIVAVSVDENDHPLYVKMEVVESLNQDGARDFAVKYVVPDSKIITDGLNIYTIISNAKAFVAGTFHGLDRNHLQRYLNEFCYRFNRRHREPELFNRLLKACTCARPVTYAELT